MGDVRSVWLGVDFGRTETTAALLAPTGGSWPLRLTDQAAGIPSASLLSPTASLEVGAIASLLRTAIARAQTECGGQLPEGLVLSHPSWWTVDLTQPLVAAAGEAGYPPERVRLIPKAIESVSAATTFEPVHTTVPTPADAPAVGGSSARAWLIVAAVIVLIGSAIVGAAVLQTRDSADAAAAQPKTIEAGSSQGVGYTAVDPDNHRLYTSDTLDYTISVIDTAAEKRVKTLPFASVTGMAMDPAIRALWVLGKVQKTDTVSLIRVDTRTDTVVGSVSIPTNTRTIAVHPTTHDVYSSQANGDVVDKSTGAKVVATVVDALTMRVSASITAPGHGVDIAVNPVTGLVYLNAGGSLRVIDPMTKALLGLIDSPVGGELLAVDSRTNTAYLSSGTTVSAFDLAKGTFLQSIDIGYQFYWIASDSGLGYIYAPESGADGTPRLSVIDTATRTVVKVIDMAASAEGITADPLTHRVYVRPLRDYVQVIDICAEVGCN